MSASWLVALLALTSAVVGLGAWIGRWAWRILSRTTRFLDDFFGEPSHDGLPPKPGVMARLEVLTEDVNRVRNQVIPNGGSSLRDAVDRVAVDLKEHREATTPAIRQLTADVTELRRRMEQFEAERKDRDD